MDKRLEQLKAEYHSIPIPKELDEVVNRALHIRPKKRNVYWKATALTAAAAVLLTISLHISPAFAAALSDIPVIGKIVKVITFNEISDTRNNSSLDIQTPAIEGLENEGLEDSLNSKYVEESKQLYKEFVEYMKPIKEGENGNTAIYGGYEIMTNNERILSIRRYIENIQASGYIESKFDTVDKKNAVLITLKSLFKDDSYIEVISQEIKKQMQQAADGLYWTQEVDSMEFTQINEDQNFYINSDNKLVIAFNKYEIAPGYIGAVEFIIPTEVLSDILVGDMYIK